MNEEKVYCPYCGPWNGHPNGVEMVEEGNWNDWPEQIDSPYQFWYYSCPACGSESPCATSLEEARTAAQHRFPSVEQIKWERDTAIQQLRDDYGVGFGERKRPLLLEELITLEMPWPVWVEFNTIKLRNLPDKSGLRPSVLKCLCNIGGKISRSYASFEDDAGRRLDIYGKLWRCWRTKPTNEERAAASWDGD